MNAAEVSPLRILYLATGYPPKTLGGIPVATARIAESLAGRGHDVHVLVVQPSARTRDERIGNVSVHYRKRTRIPGMQRLLASPPGRWWQRRFGFRDALDKEINDVGARLLLGWSLYREARRLGIDFDVVEAADADAQGLGFAIVRRARLVVNLHCPPISLYWKVHGYRAPGVRARFVAWLEAIPMRRAAFVTSPSSRIEAALHDEHRAVPRGVVVLPHPVDLGTWSDVPPIAEDERVILAVGRLDAMKAPEVLVRAAAIVRERVPEAEVVFVGASSGYREGERYGDWIARLAGELGVPCKFIDHVPRGELSAWYERARVVAIASHWESFSMAGLEAMASGRPIVITETAGLSDLVQRADAGTVVPPDDPIALARALEPLLLDAALAAEAADRGRRFVLRELTPEVNSSRREAVYRSLINDGRSRRDRRHDPSAASKSRRSTP